MLKENQIKDIESKTSSLALYVAKVDEILKEYKNQGVEPINPYVNQDNIDVYQPGEVTYFIPVCTPQFAKFSVSDRYFKIKREFNLESNSRKKARLQKKFQKMIKKCFNLNYEQYLDIKYKITKFQVEFYATKIGLCQGTTTDKINDEVINAEKEHVESSKKAESVMPNTTKPKPIEDRIQE